MGTTAYVYVIGIGLALWRVSSHQEVEFLATFSSCLRRLLPVIPHVSDIKFGGFKEPRNYETWKGLVEPTEKGNNLILVGGN